ncbi:hypothetical protein PIB30_055160 [Stylosanthes scabra]|uniref:Uncharacterized protein n=1 Tax=Stylosanthes scabra TaxID=79078 RepID=A0ABU6TIU1_9FABA|nr:hypothetical protein [Stylosanthes scabra]
MHRRGKSMHMRGKPPWPTSSSSSSRLDMLKRDPESPTSFSPTHRHRRPTHMCGKSPWPACIHAEPTPESFSVAPCIIHPRIGVESPRICVESHSAHVLTSSNVTSTCQHAPEPTHMHRTASICVGSNEAPSKLLKTHV